MTFFIQIIDVRHGWLDVELELASQEHRFAASHVLNDPVRELAELGLTLANRQGGDRIVEFWLEPDYLELRAIQGRELALELIAIDKSPVHGSDREQMLASEVVDQVVAAREILRCLRIARPHFPVEPSGGHWREPFPETIVSELGKALA